MSTTLIIVAVLVIALVFPRTRKPIFRLVSFAVSKMFKAK